MSKKKKNDKIIICSRCKGDGYWHSPKTGYRAKTAAGLLVDKTKKCPACNGKGEVVKPKPKSKPEPAKTKLPSAAQVAWDMSKGKSGSVTAN